MINKLTNDFLKRFLELGEFLKTNKDVELLSFSTSRPVDKQVVDDIERYLFKAKFDERFLAYFQESDGYELRYKIGSEIEGAIRIPGLEEMFDNHIGVYTQKGDYTLKTLGGRDDFEIRSKMYCFDKYDEWQDENRFYSVNYVVGDNVLLLADDYDACITDSNPITVPSYFELCLATAGLVNRRDLLNRNCDGNYKIIDFPMKSYEGLYPWNKSIDFAKHNAVSAEFNELTKLVKEAKE